MKHIFTLLAILGAFNSACAAEQSQAGTGQPKVILRLSDGTGLPLKQRELSRMGTIKNLLETQDDTQEANEPLEIPLDDHLVTPEAGTLLMHLMENVLSDENYENIPEIEAINSNKKIVEKQLNWLTDKRRLASNVHRFNLLKELYGAADYLNVQLLKTEAQNGNPEDADHALQKLITHEVANSLIASDFGSADLNINHNNLHEQLKFEMAQRYNNKVLVNEVLVNDHQGRIWDAQLCTDGNTLITHSWDKVMVHNAQTGVLLLSVDKGVVNGHQEDIYITQLNSDGHILMTHSHNKVMVHDVQSGDVLLSVDRGDADGHQELICSAQLSTDGNILMTYSHDEVMVHDVQSGDVLYVVTRGDVDGHQHIISQAQLSPNGARLITYSNNKVIVHDIQNSAVLCAVTRGDADSHQGNIGIPLLSADGNILITHSNDKLMLHNTQTGSLLYAITKGDANGHQQNIIWNVELSPDWTTLITYSSDRIMHHNLPITVHSNQKYLNKFITKFNNDNKTVSIYQITFTEEIARDLSLEQIYAAVYAQQRGQEFPKISIIFAGENDQIQAIFIEAPAQQTFLQRAAAFASQHKTAIAITSGVVATGAVLYAGPTAIYQAAKDKIKRWFSK